MLIQRVVALLFLLLLLSGCVEKSRSIEREKASECGEGTVLASTTIGAVAGAIIGELSGASVAGAIVGSVVGGVEGEYLKKLQCNYAAKERILVKNIRISKQHHHQMIAQINQMNQQMTQLYGKITHLRRNDEQIVYRYQALLGDIAIKRDEITALAQLNQNVAQEVNGYYTKVKDANYKRRDKNFLAKTLLQIINNQKKIANSCRYNLNQLQHFEQKVRSVQG